MFLRIITAALLAFSFACTDKKPNHSPVTNFVVEDYSEVIKEINLVLVDLKRQVGFSGYTDRDLFNLESALRSAEAGLLGLSTQQDRTSIYIRLTTALEAYDKTVILERDQSRLDEKIFNKVRYVVHRLKPQVQAFGEGASNPWNLYNYNFSAGLEPEFRTQAAKLKFGSYFWGTNLLIDLPKVGVAGDRGANSWLISRAFDLSAVKNPSFRFDTSLLVDSKDQTLDRKKAIESNFQVYIVLDPKPYDDFTGIEDVEIEDHPRLKRIYYSADEMPLGERFHKKWVPSKSLSDYKDQPIAIAFRFNPMPGASRQYHMWQIYDFEINGEGVIPENTLKYQTKFDGYKTPEKFHKASFKSGGKSWRAGNYNGVGYMLAERGADSDTWFLSPRYFISKDAKMPYLSLSQTFNKEAFTENAFSKMQVLISEDFFGGDPNNATWKSIDYVAQIDVVEPKGWNKVVSDNLDLSDYIGKEFVLAFRYQSEKVDKHSWQVNGFTISAASGSVAPLAYRMGCLTPDPEADKIFYTYDLERFSSKDLKTVTVSGKPARWNTKDLDAGACLPNKFYQISGFNGTGKAENIGETLKVLPTLDLTEEASAYVRLLFSLKYWKKPSVAVVISELGSDEWTNVPFSNETFGRDEVVNFLTPWVKIPDAFIGKKVKLAFKYVSDRGSTPRWDVIRLEVKRD